MDYPQTELETDVITISGYVVSEEQQFMKLYQLANEYILDNNPDISIDDVTKSEDDLRESFLYGKGRKFSDIDLSEIRNRCAYIYRYATLHSGLVRNLVSKTIKDCKKLRWILNAKEVDIVSLGGGPGNDLIGFCSALYENRNLVISQSLNLTLVDSTSRWSSCFNILEFLIRENKFGNVSELFQVVDISTTFIKADLTGREALSRKYVQAMAKADIVTLVKVLSVVDGDKYMIANGVMNAMKPGSLLLIIDAPEFYHLFAEFELIYRSFNKEEFNLDATFDMCVAVKSTAYIQLLRKPFATNARGLKRKL